MSKVDARGIAASIAAVARANPVLTELAPRHPEGCAFCPAELLGLERDRNGDPLCQTCPHLRAANKAASLTKRQREG